MTDEHDSACGAAQRLRAHGRAVAADALLDRLLHDMKQPLNLARAVAQDVRIDVRKGRLDASQLPESMQEIESAIDQVVLRIQQIRTFMRPESPTTTVGATDVAVACDKALSRLARAHRHPVRVSRSLAKALPPVKGDPLAIEQALWELLDNGAVAAADAVDATGEHGDLVLSAIRSGEDVVVTVKDNGAGVAAEVRSEIFKPFFTTRPGQSGIGLALAMVLLKDAGGSVRLADSDAGGSVFEVTLKALKTQQERARPEEPRS